VIIEPVALEAPVPGFLEGVVALARREGAVSVFDEMISGFRYDARGASGLFGVVPDLSTWGKALANGFSVAALTGRRDIMELGGLRHARDRVFLLSATHGAEGHALRAAQRTVEEVVRHDVPAHVTRLGRRLREGLTASAAAHGLAGRVRVLGYDQSPVLACLDEAGAADLSLRTLMLQEFCRHGILIPYIAISLSHSDAEVDRTVQVFDTGVAQVLARAVRAGTTAGLLESPAVKPVFRRRN